MRVTDEGHDRARPRRARRSRWATEWKSLDGFEEWLSRRAHRPGGCRQRRAASTAGPLERPPRSSGLARGGSSSRGRRAMTACRAPRGKREPERPLAVVNSVAPIRICDNGCWTDTWFAGHGQVFNIAVYPYAEVQVAVSPRRRRRGPARPPRRELRRALRGAARGAALGPAPPPRGRDRVHEGPARPAPRGHDPLRGAGGRGHRHLGRGHGGPRRRPRRPHPRAASRRTRSPPPRSASRPRCSHRQCGIQDQLASAYGGINYIEMFVYPHASVSPVLVPNPVWWELERRLLLVYLGKSHDSSALHEAVIRSLESAGPDSPAIVDAAPHRAALARRALRRRLRGPRPGHDREHRGAGAAPPGPRRHRGPPRHRDREGARRARLEGQRRGRRGRLAHAALRRELGPQARARPRDRAGLPGLPAASRST